MDILKAKIEALEKQLAEQRKLLEEVLKLIQSLQTRAYYGK